MKKKILIIEDEADVRENLIELLAEEGYEALGAKNGFEGLANIKTFRPDLVICDILMPGMDGYEVLKRVQDEKINIDKPFIFLSAITDSRHIREGMNLGADDYLTKPYTRKDLLDAVTARLNKAALFESKSSRLRESIITTLPHELLTPLNLIYMASDIMREPNGSFSRAEIVEYGDLIYSAANKINDVFTKYLMLLEIQLARTDENKLDSIAKDLCIFPDDIIGIVANEKAVMYERKADLHMKLDRAQINIDERNLYRLAHEIIDNAFKFSAPGSKVTIRSGSSFSDYLLSVSNEGSTMSADEILMVGEFMRYNRARKMPDGLGLGLSIARSICENYGANFDLTSSDNSVTVNCRFKIKK